MTQQVEETYEVAKPILETASQVAFSATPMGALQRINDGVQSYTEDTDGSLLLKVFHDPVKLSQHKEAAISAEDFIQHAKSHTFESLRDEADAARNANSASALGPAKDYRYVIDPSDPNKVIDMRHFLVVGSKGEGFGLGVEAVQGVFGNPSAFDPQDFYSNALGSRFFEQYNDQEDFATQLEKFFHDRRSNK